MRWTYLIPRILILCLIVGAIWLAKDPLIRRALIHQAENATGAKVEIGQVRTSLANRKLFLQDVKIADPRDPMTNLVQSELAYLKIDLESLYRREFVVESGQTSQLMFGVPRTESGDLKPGAINSGVQTKLQPAKTNSLESFSAEDEELRSAQAKELEIVRIGQHWLDQLMPASNASPAQQQFETPRLAKQFRQQWQRQIAEYRERIGKIAPQLKQLQSELQTDFENPLRDPERFALTSAELKRLQTEAKVIRKSLNQLQLKISSEKEALLTAKTRDEQKLRQITRVNQFDSRSISELLLHQSQGELVAEVIDWFRWFRSSIPDPETEFLSKRTRGTNVVFTGSTPKPKFLIKRLDLEGEGRFASQHLRFAGTAVNLTTQPQRHDQPASFELRAQGNQHVIVKCTIDRRSTTPIDSLNIQCPNLSIDGRTLGHADSLLVSMGSGSSVHANIDLRVEGDTLSGQLTFQHYDVSLHVDQLNEMAGGADTALRLNQDLSKVNQFQSKIALSGTVDDYQYEIDSDLGSKFSATVDRVVVADIENKINQQQLELDAILKNEIHNLEQTVATALADLAKQVNVETFQIAELIESIESSSNSWPPIRR